MLASASPENQTPDKRNSRLKCYDYIETTFQALLEQRQSAMFAGQWAERADPDYDRLKWMVLDGGSEECCHHLFRWYLDKGKESELLQIDSERPRRFLVDYLTANNLEFLAEYYRCISLGCCCSSRHTWHTPLLLDVPSFGMAPKFGPQICGILSSEPNLGGGGGGGWLAGLVAKWWFASIYLGVLHTTTGRTKDSRMLQRRT
jgi:hypothetical protein